MSNPTASAAGGAMPAEGHKTRRAALALFGAAPALAVFPAAAMADDADRGLLALIAQWRAADTKANAIDMRVSELEDAIRISPPDVLIKTAEDAELFIRTE